MGASSPPMTKSKDQADDESADDLSSLSNSSEKTYIETVGVRTLMSDKLLLERGRGAKVSEEAAESKQQLASKNHMHNHVREAQPPDSSSSSSSTFKRYKFGLTNHFLTMPDGQVDQLNTNTNNNRFRNQSSSSRNKTQEATARVVYSKQKASKERSKRRQQQHSTLADDSDLDCDLSVLPPSSPDSLLSSSGAENSQQQQREIAATATTTENSEASMLPAGDAGLDAGRCNSKANKHNHITRHNHPSAKHTQAAAEDCYLDSMDEASPSPLHHPHHHHHHEHSHHPSVKQHPAYDGGGTHQYQQKQQYNQRSEHMRKKKLKLSGEPPEDGEDCASNGLLVRLSSVMYATFLVILGCILHVSELRQKSRNSSDHIYTTVVALIGIFWLLFLQGDLQRYKRYASKFILLESIFNDHQHASQQQHQREEHHQAFGRLAHHGGGGGLLALDPSARSTTSSSASLVNGGSGGVDRMSMNTEVIFKKTAYKMYQQQAAAAGAPSTHHSHQLTMNPLRHNPTESSGYETATPPLVPAYKFLHGKMGANFYLKCGMAAFCFGHVIHEGLRFGQQVYFFATANLHCRDSAALVAHLVTPLYSFYQLFMMFKYSNLVINRHKILARFGLMHIIGTCVTFWFRTILEEAFEDFVHKMDYFKAQNKPIIHYLDPTGGSSSSSSGGVALLSRANNKQHGTESELLPPPNSGLAHWLSSLASLTASESMSAAGGGRDQLSTTAIFSNGSNQTIQQQPAQNLTQLAQSTLLALMSSPMSATMTPQIVRHLPDSYHCAQNTLLTTKSMNALPYLYPFTIEYNLLIAAIFLSLYFNIGKLGGGGGAGSSNESNHRTQCYMACCRRPYAISKQPASSSSGASLSYGGGSQLDLAALGTSSSVLAGDTSSSKYHLQHHQLHHLHHTYAGEHADKFAAQLGEYKSNFVVNADCHAANKGLFLGFFVLLVTLVTIVIFFVTINKPSHLQLGIKINLIQEATLTSLILIVTLAGYRQIMRLNANPFIKNNITTDDVLMLIPLPFFFIHSLLSIRAETATLYSPHHLTLPTSGAGGGGGVKFDDLLQSAAARNHSAATSQATSQQPVTTHQRVPRTPDFMLGLPSGLRASNSSSGSGSSSSTRQAGTANRLHQPQPLFRTTDSNNATNSRQQQPQPQSSQPQTQKIDHYKLLTIVLNLAVMIEVLVQTNFIIDGLRRCSESRYLRYKKPGRELITFAIILNITYWIVATFETKSVEQYKTEIDYYGPLPYMFISHTTLPVMLFYRYHSSVCLAEIWNRAYKPPKRR